MAYGLTRSGTGCFMYPSHMATVVGVKGLNRNVFNRRQRVWLTPSCSTYEALRVTSLMCRWQAVWAESVHWRMCSALTSVVCTRSTPLDNTKKRSGFNTDSLPQTPPYVLQYTGSHSQFELVSIGVFTTEPLGPCPGCPSLWTAKNNAYDQKCNLSEVAAMEDH